MKSAFTEQDLYFIRTHPHYSLDELTKIIGMPKEDIKKVLSDFGFSAKNTNWTDKEIQYLKNNYTYDNIPKLMDTLHRSKSSIMHKAIRLGLTDPNKSINKRYQHWTPKEDALLKNNKELSNTELAKLLNHSPSAIGNRKIRFGLTTKKWSKKENEYLLSHYESMTYKEIAKKLNRSYFSVKSRATRLGLSKFTNYISANQLAKSFNTVPSTVINTWINKYGLPANKIVLSSYAYFQIDTNIFWNWAINHQDIVPFKQYEQFSLLPEPDNLNELIRNSKIKENSHKLFTVKEIQQIKKGYGKGKPIKKIAEEHQRTINSIRHVIWREDF